ncbi:MAG: helix-turn-helix transcriptional regulator [SAR324 cluster bacterium]|nr:helix-turn-helix transcriptional regulator [SAR324 cluster bacterium]
MLVLEEAAQGFAAVGSEPRLTVLLILVRACPEGLSIGEIQEKLKMPASTLAHHLRFLAAADLVLQEKRGREVISRANYQRIKFLADYLLEECCQDSQASEEQKHDNLTRKEEVYG